MKCELCHQAEAETVLVRENNGEEEELYVCKGCAADERKNRQKKSQRTRKVTGLPPGVSMSITEVSGDGAEPPPILSAIMNAFNDMVRNIEEDDGRGAEASDGVREREAKPAGRKAKAPVALPCGRMPRAFRFDGRLHLEGLHLIGEIDQVVRAVRDLGLSISSVDADGVRRAAHVFSLGHFGAAEQAKRVAREILRQEENARERLRNEMPRVYGDAICRALAILKNCRLLAPAELYDLLSPIRLAALDGLLDGIGLAEVESIASKIDLSGGEDNLSDGERDEVDGERADRMNKRFEDVVLNERAEGKYL